MDRNRATSNLQTIILVLATIGFFVTAIIYWLSRGRSSQLGLILLGSSASVVAGGLVAGVVITNSRITARRRYMDTYKVLSNEWVESSPSTRKLTDDQKGILQELLSAMTKEIAESRSLPLSSIDARILVLAGDGRTLEPIADQSLGGSFDTPSARLLLSDEGPAARAAAKREPYVVSFDSDAQSSGAPSWVIATPILAAGGKSAGVLVVQATSDHSIGQDDVERLQSSVSQMIYWSQLAGLILGGLV